MMKSASQMRGPVKIKAKSPVISGRVPEAVHRQIKQAAKKSGRSMSDEIAYLVVMAFRWGEVLGEFEQAKKTLAEMTQDNAETKLGQLGWGSVAELKWGGRVWFAPGRHRFPQSGWVDPNKEPPPVSTPAIIPDPQFVDAVAAIIRAIPEPIAHALKAALDEAALDKEGGK